MSVVFDESIELKDNAMLKVRPDLFNEWCFEKNNELDIYKITKGNSKKAWWICELGHEWKTGVYNRTKGSGCPYCSGYGAWKGFNDMWTTAPLQASWLLDPNDGYIYTRQSNKKVDWKCPNCDSIIKNKTISDVHNQNLPCPSCSDGFSFPEKVMYNVLRLIGVNFETQKTFEWSDKKRYDFYLVDYNMIIETHGKQHRVEDFSFIGGRSLAEEQRNDKFKYDLAKSNGITNYLTIDCRKSKFEYIKDNIIKSSIGEMFDLNSMDWDKVELLSHKISINIVAELWNKGLSVSEIVEKTNIGYDSIRNSLINGAKLRICDYTTKEAHMRGNKVFNKPVVKLSLDGECLGKFRSMKEASNGSKGLEAGISSCCRGISPHSHGFIWLYEEDYNKFLKGEIKLERLADAKFKKIKQFDLEGNLIKTWESLSSASEELGVKKEYIKRVCEGERNKSGGFKWEYVEESKYITHNNEVVTTFNHIEEESNNLNDEPNTNSSIGNFF